MKELTNSLIAHVGGGAELYGTVYCTTNNSTHFMGVYSVDHFDYAEAFCQELGFDHGYCKYQGALDYNAIYALNRCFCDKHSGSKYSTFDPSGLRAYMLEHHNNNNAEHLGL